MCLQGQRGKEGGGLAPQSQIPLPCTEGFLVPFTPFSFQTLPLTFPESPPNCVTLSLDETMGKCVTEEIAPLVKCLTFLPEVSSLIPGTAIYWCVLWGTVFLSSFCLI